MIAEFIGQGIHEGDYETCGNYICSSIKNSLFENITVFVAFVRKQGVLELKPFIEKAIEENRKVTFYVGRNEFITTKEALELLLELGVSTYIYKADNFIYHPKVYLFEGSKNRIITGSSNLTKTGLFFNVECSLLLDFSSQDSAGMKVLNQLKDYFSPLLDFSDPNLEFVTQEHIDNLFAEGLIPSEELVYDLSYTVDPNGRHKGRRKLPEIGELGNLEITEDKPRKQYKDHVLTITDAYLRKWDYMFERMKAYKEQFGTTTVKRDYADHLLYAWYRKQKLLYKHPELNMPQAHIDKLRSIDFYFGDGHKLREEQIFHSWLDLLKDALDNNERIILNQWYTYKGKKLGTWLMSISQANKKGKKLHVRQQIEALGFDYANNSKAVENVIARLLDDLYKAENPNKLEWRTRFYKHLNKKDKLDQKTRDEIEFVWEYQFGEKPVWEKQHDGYTDRTDEWKRHRQVVGQWYPIKIVDGQFQNLYSWARRKLTSKKTMEKIKHKFTEAELDELRSAGFPV